MSTTDNTRVSERWVTVQVELEIALEADAFPEAQAALAAVDLTNHEVVYAIREAVERTLGWNNFPPTVAWDESGNIPIQLGRVTRVAAISAVESQS